jgi:hypothetical protein
MQMRMGLGISRGARSSSTPTATNLVSYSEEMGNVVWGVAGSATISNNVANAPTGAATADRYNEAGSASLFQRATMITVAASTVHTASVYLKRGNTDWVRFLIGDQNGFTNGQAIWFNLGTGAKGSIAQRGAGWPTTAYDIIADADGWYRVYATFTTNGTSFNIGMTSASADASNTRANIGSGVGVGVQILWWGAMLETGSSLSAYVARAA